eukprot:771611_1
MQTTLGIRVKSVQRHLNVKTQVLIIVLIIVQIMISNTPRSRPYMPKMRANEPFCIVPLDEAITDLEKKSIVYHGLFKVYSPVIETYLDIAGVLTMDRLYLVSAIKHQLWQEFRERTQIDQ